MYLCTYCAHKKWKKIIKASPRTPEEQTSYPHTYTYADYKASMSHTDKNVFVPLFINARIVCRYFVISLLVCEKYGCKHVTGQITSRTRLWYTLGSVGPSNKIWRPGFIIIVCPPPPPPPLSLSHMSGMQRPDPQDSGPQYRSAIGIPGGIDGPLMDIVRDSNVKRMRLVAGTRIRQHRIA
jgi:hypothetical protein